jgi:hypothetical protein
MLVTMREAAVSQVLARTLALLAEVMCGLPKSVPAHVRIVPESLWFHVLHPIHYSVIIDTGHCIV